MSLPIEPSCIHSHGTQPAGMCDKCCDAPFYLLWLAEWDRWKMDKARREAEGMPARAR